MLVSKIFTLSPNHALAMKIQGKAVSALKLYIYPQNLANIVVQASSSDVIKLLQSATSGRNAQAYQRRM